MENFCIGFYFQKFYLLLLIMCMLRINSPSAVYSVGRVLALKCRVISGGINPDFFFNNLNGLFSNTLVKSFPFLIIQEVQLSGY